MRPGRRATLNVLPELGSDDRALAVERELSENMAAHGYRFHDPLYSLLFAQATSCLSCGWHRAA